MSKYLPIGERLREEREKIGLNQADFAALGGATRKTQYNYETGERAPDGGYLAEIAAAGADVNYILTGNRILSSNYPAAITKVEGLSREEAALLDNFRHIADKGDQAAVKRMALLAATAAKHEKEQKAWNGVDRRKGRS